MRIWAVLIVLACASPAFAAPSALQRECDAARKKPAAARGGQAVNPFAVRVTKSSEPIRSVTLRRFVECGYRNKKFLRALETLVLQVNTQDRGDVQFDTKNGNQGKSYFVECETELNTPLAKLVKGYKAALSLSCVHRIARLDGGEHDRVTGVHSFKPKQGGTIEVTAAKGLTVTLRFDASAENQFELLRLDAEATGVITNALQIFECPPRNDRSRRPVPAPCGG